MPFTTIMWWAKLIGMISMVFGQQQFFTKEPTDVEATQGGKVVLPCQVQNKVGVLQWTRDGFGLGQNRSLPGFPSMRMVGRDPNKDWNLEIVPVRLEDEGIYQCQVTSGHSSVPPIRSSTAHLVVLIPSGPPTIINKSSLTMTEGVEAAVICESEGGKPAAQLEWRVSGVKIKNINTETEKTAGTVTFKTKTTLRLVPTKTIDGTSISCVISSTGSSTSAKLNVIYKPVVKISHDKTTITEGDTLMLSCDADAKPESFLYIWSLNNKEISRGDNENFIMEKITRHHNNAMVTCTAENSVGRGEETEQLDVHYKPRIRGHPKSVSSSEGKTVELECDAEGNPKPTISWHRVNTTDIVGTGPYHQVLLTELSSGLYFCSAHSSKFTKSAVSNIARVTISKKPKISSQQEQSIPIEDGKATVRCSADTFALEATVEWSFKGKKIVSGSKYSIENIVDELHFESVLTILDATEDDFGHYLCSVENAIGSSSKDILVSIYFEGVFNDLLFLQIFLGTAGLLTCVLSVIAIKKFCYSLQHSFGSIPQIPDHEDGIRSEIFRDNMLREIMEDNKETKVMSKQLDYPEDEKDVSAGHVLQTINMDYAAFYGNHHLSNNLADEDSDDDEPEQKTFSSHPYLIT